MPSIGPRTRSQEQSQKTVKRADFKRYLRRRGRENNKRWLEMLYPIKSK